MRNKENLRQRRSQYKEWTKPWSIAYHKEYSLQYSKLNRKKLKEKLRQFRKANPNYYKIWERSRPTFWLCDMCSKPLGRWEIQLDHNHKTGEWRGWLCSRCKLFVGHLESPLFERGMRYLK